MIDNFALALAHGLIAVAVWRMVMRMDLNTDEDSSATGDTPDA